MNDFQSDAAQAWDPQEDPSTSTAEAPPAASADPRRDQRFSVARPLLAVPVFPNLRPDEAHRFLGTTLNISPGGLVLRTSHSARPASHQLVVGVEVTDGQWNFATLEVRRVDPIDGGMRVAGRFAPPARDILRRENLMPTLQAHSYRFAANLPDETLRHWYALGVLQRAVMDRVLVCPQCSAAPTFRRGCAGCGSLRVESPTLLHHYACAYVGEARQFEDGDELTCPKCRSRSLVVGADFEHLESPYLCRDCGWRDSELELVGHCRLCDLQFPVRECREEELIGYHVERLDPLALVDAV